VLGKITPGGVILVRRDEDHLVGRVVLSKKTYEIGFQIRADAFAWDDYGGRRGVVARRCFLAAADKAEKPAAIAQRNEALQGEERGEYEKEFEGEVERQSPNLRTV
jgi:hypothetical protein